MVDDFISRRTEADFFFNICSEYFNENDGKASVVELLFDSLPPCKICAQPPLIFQNILETYTLKDTSGSVLFLYLSVLPIARYQTCSYFKSFS